MSKVTVKQRPLRQRIRALVLIVFMLSFPIMMNFISPYVIIDGASQGVVAGSFIVFGLLFVSAFFFGRLWCSWACPGGAFQEISFAVNAKPVNPKKLDWIKWVVWGLWVVAIAAVVISAGGYTRVNFLHLTETGISVDEPVKYITYYFVILLIILPGILGGRRVMCHTICWMAPFLILGRKLRNLLNTPALRLQANAGACIHCNKCTQGCPMSLDVEGLVNSPSMEHSECILCGSCVDACPKDVIHYTFSRGK
ncbi:MAG: 4Fe-4S binding protein [Anaerolineae bacterium]|nr:4Fe-4S binding protein [Anaerolineae bacterium]